LTGVAVLVLVVMLQLLAQYITSRDTVRFWSVLVWFAFELTSLLFALSALFRWTRSRSLRWGFFVGLGMLLAAAIGSAWGFAFHALSQALPQLGLRAFTTPSTLTRIVLYGLTQAQTHFGLWTLAFLLPSVLEDARVGALQAAALAAESEQLRTAAELARLRGHLEPHFLLNTLNAIAGLVTEEPREARRLLSALGDLLRDALKDDGDSQPLAAQVEWLKRYAQILETRHRGDLNFSWEISSDSESTTLPRLLLQPLLENAVKHGALRARGVGHVWVKAELMEDGSRLRCSVRDNGPGVPPGPVRHGAFGLESVRRRVELRYGVQGRVSLTASPEGTTVSVDVPATIPSHAMGLS
jgi:signal transduction histidine kinase